MYPAESQDMGVPDMGVVCAILMQSGREMTHPEWRFAWMAKSSMRASTTCTAAYHAQHPEVKISLLALIM